MSSGRDEIVFRVCESLDVTLMVTQLMRHPFLADASETDRNALVTVASELGTNIVKYAERGAVSLRRRWDGQRVVIDVLAEDHGPGIADIELALQDHFSTGQSLGLGLPAVRRMMDSLHVESVPGHGLRVSASKRLNGDRSTTSLTARAVVTPRVSNRQFEVGVATRPLPGKQACGDATYCRRDDQGVLVGIFDGLGHGSAAAQAATSACAALDHVTNLADLKSAFDALHQALRSTVGAVAALCHVAFDSGLARYAGIGNTSGMRVLAERWVPISRDGVLGQRLPGIFEQTIRLAPGDLLALWTDGVAANGLPQYLSFNVDKDLVVLAGEAVQQFGRGYDDAGLLLFRWRGV